MFLKHVSLRNVKIIYSHLEVNDVYQDHKMCLLYSEVCAVHAHIRRQFIHSGLHTACSNFLFI